MALPNIYKKEVVDEILNRINQLTPNTQPIWGTMNASQMLAHCCVTYKYVFDEVKDDNNFFMRFMLKRFVRNVVTNEMPYKKSSRTGPLFLITDERDFEKEKENLFTYIQRVLEKGETYFEGKVSSNFGVMNSVGWNNLMYKHLDHHLKQFGV